MSGNITPVPGANVIVTIIPGGQVQRTIIAVLTLPELTRVFNRALNTWESPPKHLMGIADALNSLLGMHVSALQEAALVRDAGPSPQPETPSLLDTLAPDVQASN